MEKIKEVIKKDLARTVITIVLLSFAINFVIEAVSRQGLSEGFSYLLTQPLVFFYNMLIILATLSIAILVKRRLFVYIVVGGTWLGIGIANGVILSNRMTPFTTKDLQVLEDGLSIVPNYLSTKEIVFLCIGIAIAIALLVLIFIKGPRRKEKIDPKKYIATFLIIMVLMGGSSGLAIKTGVVETFFGNLAYAYRDFGFPYCFINTWVNTGVNRPMGYNEKAVKAIFAPGELGEDGIYVPEVTDVDEKLPNIVVVQLESFIDPYMVKTITCSEDPVPNWRKMMDECSSGYFTAPAVGAGTANTEFEVLSGMSVKFFGPGEYPYKSILREETCETVAYILKNMGFKAHAIHNHRGAFYGRNQVYPNLGFDTFTSIEYMNHVVKTPKNWAKDQVLTEQILAALDSDSEHDFVFTVSVQGHGKYPTEQVIEMPDIEVTAPTEELQYQYVYYVNQIHEMDKWLGELTTALSKYPEPVVLVLYGDHIPALEMKAEEMESGDLYNTQYLIWANYKIKAIDKDLHAYQLMPEVFDRLGIHDGTLMLYHQNHSEDEAYLANLKTLEYDMLYGKRFIYGGKTPFEPTDMRMGIRPIKIEEVVQIGENYYIKGENFTQYSKISLDGEILNTIYLGPTVLGLLEEVNPEDVDRMKISQVEKYNEILSTTE